MITVKTFAQVREITGEEAFCLALPAQCDTVGALKSHLQSRSESWQQVLSDGLLCAVNQALSDDSSPLKDHDEVAFFPPVTGG